jgi:hypothetical protein
MVGGGSERARSGPDAQRTLWWRRGRRQPLDPPTHDDHQCRDGGKCHEAREETQVRAQ